jgi:hypothetical protein
MAPPLVQTLSGERVQTLRTMQLPCQTDPEMPPARYLIFSDLGGVLETSD